jgi:hypothetical protein
MVTLVNLTTGVTEWIGFLAAEVFTQPWGKDMTELEFPLKSALACLEDVTIQTGVTGTQRFALLVYQAFASLFGENEVPFANIMLMDDFSNICDNLLIRANYDKFFSKKTIMNGNTEEVIKVGETYASAISDMCKCFGTTLRQQGTTLIFGHYDNGGDYSVNINVFTWDILKSIANSTDFPEVTGMGQIPTRDLLTLANFRGDKNKISFIPGGKDAIVNLELNAESRTIIELPTVEIVEGGVASGSAVESGEYIAGKKYVDGSSIVWPIYINWTEAAWKMFNFQYVARSNNKEAFDYRFNTVTLTSGNNINIQRTHGGFSASSAADLIARFFFTSLGYPYYSYNQQTIVTGALPGKYSEANGMLEDCIMLVQDVQTTSDSGTSPSECYFVQNSPTETVEMKNCYINIDFDIPVTIFSIVSKLLMTQVFIPVQTTYTLTGESAYATSQMVGSLTYSMVCRLYIIANDGHNYFWNGSGWNTDTVTDFYIPIKGNSIQSNYDTTMDIDKASGILAYVGDKTGRVIFQIMNIATINDKMSIIKGSEEGDNVDVYAYPFQRIITGLKVDLVYSREITNSSRSSNTYRRTIIGKGFSEEKQIDLTFGTWNQNVPCTALLKNYDNSGYEPDLGYTKSDGSVVAERMEIHLLNRMVEYYKEVRRTMEAKIATGIDLFRNRFSYNGRKYMAIDKKHDWEREEQEVKFIEVS